MREERVLAWILHRTLGEADPYPELPASMFTTDARSEILLAWRDLAARTDLRDDWLVEGALISRLLRAPGWAQASIGPDGANVTGYLRRLTNTPVTREQAESAVAWLVAQDKVTGRSGAAANPAMVRPRAEPVEPLPPRLSPPGRGPLPGM